MSRLRRSVPLALCLFLASFLQPGFAQSTAAPTKPAAARAELTASEEKIGITLTLAHKIASTTPAHI